jgi:hypothetical protein
MRNSRRLVGGLALALMMSTGLSADAGAPGGGSRDTCGFLQGVLYKVGSPAVVGAVFEAVFGCDLTW